MSLENIKSIAIIGAGMMGHGIAQIFALANYNVYLQSRKKETIENALENIRSNYRFLNEKGFISTKEIETALNNIHTTHDSVEAAQQANFVIESVAEDLEVKQEVFKQLDDCTDSNTIISTNTSVMSITEIASKAKNRDRIVGTHFWNPPYLIPLVEVIKAKDTSQKTIDITMELLKNVGKHPVFVKKDVPGFVANRLQHALWREAISIVDNEIADAETVDECIKMGPGIRLPVLAPLENADLVGLDLTHNIHSYILKHLDKSDKPASILQEKVSENQLGVKSGNGFYNWSEEKGSELKEKLKEYLVQYFNKPPRKF